MFDRAQSRLILLKETEEVTARDILDVFRDLCSDVSQDGKKVEKRTKLNVTTTKV
mgnify:CR=1 FL=1